MRWGLREGVWAVTPARRKHGGYCDTNSFHIAWSIQLHKLNALSLLQESKKEVQRQRGVRGLCCGSAPIRRPAEPSLMGCWVPGTEKSRMKVSLVSLTKVDNYRISEMRTGMETWGRSQHREDHFIGDAH